MHGKLLVDGAHLIARGALHAGIDLYVGYPITPASGIYTEMMRAGVGIAAPDEITAFQYLIGAALNGHRVMTATSAPGFLLMAEGIGEALAMEVPVTLVLVQRLGPATGSATMNAQGDLLMAANIVSGGFTLPLICPSSMEELPEITVLAVNLAEILRAPVVLLTEKDMVVGKRTIDPARLQFPEPIQRRQYTGDPAAFETYGNLDDHEVPGFRPLGDSEVRIRATASTHDERGMLTAFNERVRAATERLLICKHLELFPTAREDLQPGAEELVLTYGFTSYAAQEAVNRLRAEGRRVSLVVVRTLFPLLLEPLRAALAGVRRLCVVEENLTGQYATALLGGGLLQGLPPVELRRVNGMGSPITPDGIVAALSAPPALPGSRAGATPAAEVTR